MIYPHKKSPIRREIPNQTALSHPHFFEQLNDNLKMRYLTIKQRINSNPQLPLDQKKKSLDQSSRGYLELRELTKEMQFVCLKESISTEFIEAYEVVITSQQLSLTRIQEILLQLKQSFEDHSSYFHLISKEMQRRKDLLHKIIVYLKKFQELSQAEKRQVLEQPVSNIMPVLYDIIEKTVERLCQYRDTTLETLERIASWKESLNRIMVASDEDKKEEVMRKVFFVYNGQNIMEVIANQTQKLCNTFLKQYIPFKQESETDPLLLHPYKLASLSDDKAVNRPPFNILFNMNRKYVQRLSKSEFFFKKQLESSRNRDQKLQDHPQFKIYQKIFSKKFYEKAVKRGKLKQLKSVASIPKRFDTDDQNQDHFLPLLKGQMSYQTQKSSNLKKQLNQVLPEPVPLVRSRIIIKPPLPNFKRIRTQPDNIDQELEKLVKQQIAQKQEEIRKSNILDDYEPFINIKEIIKNDRAEISPEIFPDKKQTIKMRPMKSSKPFSLSNNVISLIIGEKPQIPTTSPMKTSLSPISKQKRAERHFSLYKYDVLTPISTMRFTSTTTDITQPPKQPSPKKEAIQQFKENKSSPRSPTQLKPIQNQYSPMSSSSSRQSSARPVELENKSMQYGDPSQLNLNQGTQPPIIALSPVLSSTTPKSPRLSLQLVQTDSVLSIKPIVNLPQPQSEIIDPNPQQFTLKQVQIHDWKLSEYVSSWKKKYTFSTFASNTIPWENLYIYQLKGKAPEPYSVIILKKIRGFYKSCMVLGIVFICCGTLEILNTTFQLYRQKALSYQYEHQIMIQIEREKLPQWLEPILKESLFEKQGNVYSLTVKSLNKDQAKTTIKPIVELQIAGLMVNSQSPLEPNFISEDVQPFSPFNFSCQGLISCLLSESRRSNKNLSRQFRRSLEKELYLSNNVHTRKCHSLRQINNFLEAYELETFEEPELGGKKVNEEEVIVCAVNQGLHIPFPYSLIAQSNEKDALTHIIFKNTNNQVDLWRKQTDKGLQQICIIKLQRNLWMYFYKLDDESSMTLLPIYDTKIKHIGRSSSPDKQLNKCLIQTFTKQLYGKIPCKQLSSNCVYGSLYLSFDEEDLTYNSVRYNLTHKDMLYFYLPYITGICVDGDGERYSLCEVVVNREADHQGA